MTGLPPLSPLSPEWIGQMAAIPLPREDAVTSQELQRRLFTDYHIEVPVTDWQELRLVRLSLQAYNSTADVESFIEAIREVM